MTQCTRGSPHSKREEGEREGRKERKRGAGGRAHRPGVLHLLGLRAGAELSLSIGEL